MHKNATKCNKTLSKWYINKHGASKIIDTFETYQGAPRGTTYNLDLIAYNIDRLDIDNSAYGGPL
jgi:hypothetical protein